jgi:threonine dehydratase
MTANIKDIIFYLSDIKIREGPEKTPLFDSLNEHKRNLKKHLLKVENLQSIYSFILFFNINFSNNR